MLDRRRSAVPPPRSPLATALPAGAATTFSALISTGTLLAAVLGVAVTGGQYLGRPDTPAAAVVTASLLVAAPGGCRPLRPSPAPARRHRTLSRSGGSGAYDVAVTQEVGSVAGETVDRAGLAADVLRRMAHVSDSLRHRQGVAFAGLGLTPATARALHELDPDRPLPARDLADQLGCDRSNVTVLVDKLEQAGLVERRTDPADRRQKTLVVTEKGRVERDHVTTVMSDSRLLSGLTDQELRTLRDLVWKVSDGGCPEPCGPA